MQRFLLAALVLVPAILLETSCGEATGVEQFATAANQALAQGPALISDFRTSCIREKTVEAYAAALNNPQADPTKLIRPSADAIQAACDGNTEPISKTLTLSQAMTTYFTVISQLASGGSASSNKGASGQNQQQQQQSGGGGGRGGGGGAQITPPAEQDLKAAQSILGIIGQLVVSGYQSKHLQKDLMDQSDNVETVIGALSTVVSKQYGVRLDNEEATITAVFEARLQLNPRPEPPVRWLISQQWRARMNIIDAQRAKAAAYVKALTNIHDGMEKLKSNRGKLTAASVISLLQPYTSNISQLIPTLLQ
jgi:hypothetical protein